MIVNPLHKQIQVMFAGIDTVNTDLWPEQGALSEALNNIVNIHSLKGNKQLFTINVGQDILDLFAKASIEMWHRSIHSFLISASLTTTSALST